MKRFIFLTSILACLLAVGVFSQSPHIHVQSGEELIDYDGKTSDTLQSDSALYKIITIKNPGFFNYDIDVDLDSSGDGSGITATLYKRKSSKQAWVSVETVSWSGSVDTLITFSNAQDFTEVTTIATYDIPIIGTQTIAGYYISASDSILYDDSLYVAPQTLTNTDTLRVGAQTVTNTVSQGGLNTPELMIKFQGSSSSSDMLIDDIVGIINRKNY